MIRTTVAQRAEVLRALHPAVHWQNEKVWTFLAADIIDRAAEKAPYLELLCGERVPSTQPLDVWFEAQPLSPRKGVPRLDNESNTKADLALGAVRLRGTTGSGIEFDTESPDSWACFVEAKGVRRDCDFMSAYDPLRNQLERDIESLLCFQTNGRRPQRLYFTLLSPRLLKDNPRSRLYGYRMSEYLTDRSLIIRDIERCRIESRSNFGQVYPDIRERVGVLRLNWINYEDILELALGESPFDSLDPAAIPGLDVRVQELAASLREEITRSSGERNPKAGL